jgi:hypothetical protein
VSTFTYFWVTTLAVTLGYMIATLTLSAVLTQLQRREEKQRATQFAEMVEAFGAASDEDVVLDEIEDRYAGIVGEVDDN